jgi:hypothetical protein
MVFIEVIPAYGRDYTNQKAAQADWDADKDFKVSEHSELGLAAYGQYTNRADIKAMSPGASVIIRYGKLQKVMQAK